MAVPGVAPAVAYSLLLRLCFEVRRIDNVRGSNIPVLMILHVMFQLRALAGVRTQEDTDALATYVTNSFGSATIDGVGALLADGLKVNVEQVDVAERVTVRFGATCCVESVRQASAGFRVDSERLAGVRRDDSCSRCCQRIASVPDTGCFSFTVMLLNTLQINKHVLNQPADLNTSLVNFALNPKAAKWSWLCRNLRLRSSARITLLPQEPTGDSVNLTMAEMTSVSGTLHSLSETSPPSLPRFCSTAFTQVAAPGVQGGTMEVAQLRFSWAGIHVLDDVSKPVVAALEGRFLTFGRDAARAASAAGGPSSTGSSHGGGSRPPAAPSAPRGSAATPPTPSRRNKRTAPADLLPSPSSKSIRSLRSDKLQTRLAQAHEAAMAAMIDEDNRATVVTPHYIVAQVDPHMLWPDGGVIVYAQFPFLLDDSWRTPGLCLSYCRKVLCDPDPRRVGGTYEVIFTMEPADVEHALPSVDSALQGRAVASSDVTPSAAESPAPGIPEVAPSADPRSSRRTPPTMSTPLARGGERAGQPASASTDPLVSLEGGAMDDYERLDEEDLEDLPVGTTLAATPASVGTGSRAASGSAPDTGSAARTDSAAADAAGGDGVPDSRSRVSPAFSATPTAETPGLPAGPAGSPPAPPASVIGASSAATMAPSILDAAAAPRTYAPVAIASPPASSSGAAAVPPAAGLQATAAPPASTSGATAAPPPGSSAAPAVRTPASAAVPAPVEQRDGGNTQAGGARPRRQKESSPDAARGPLGRKLPAPKMAPQGLHDHYLKVLDASNAEIGLDESQTITIQKLAWSPKPTFAMRCAFVCSLDLETAGGGTSTTLSDQFFVAAYRARPGLAPVPMRVCD